MTTQSPIQSLIDQFVGQKIEMVGGGLGSIDDLRRCRAMPVPGDETLADLEHAAGAVGFSLRIVMPGAMANMDLRANRLNVHLAPPADFYGRDWEIAHLEIG